MPSRTKPAATRRADLLDAGIVVFGEKGVPAAKIEDVTRGAGVAKGTFYLYFASKDHFVAALQERFQTEFAARQAAAMEELAEDDWAGRLDAWVAAGLEAYRKNQEVHDVLFRHDTAAIAAHAEHAWSGEGLVAGLADLLRKGARAGGFAIDDLSHDRLPALWEVPLGGRPRRTL